MITLDEIQTDALAEVFNIAVGQAADTMGRMVQDEILLTVPLIQFLTRDEAVVRLDGSSERRVCSVVQHFEGCFETDAVLMFPEDKSLELVRLIIGEEMSLSEMSELEQEAMCEVGNIILNACVGALANLFGCEFRTDLPHFRAGTFAEILRLEAAGEAGDTVMLLFIDFKMQRHALTGHVAFVLGVASFEHLKDQITRFVQNFGTV